MNRTPPAPSPASPAPPIPDDFPYQQLHGWKLLCRGLAKALAEKLGLKIGAGTLALFIILAALGASLWAIAQINRAAEMLVVLPVWLGLFFGCGWAGCHLESSQVPAQSDSEGVVVEAWVESLMAQGPQMIEHEFHPLNSPRPFKLKTTFRVCGSSQGHEKMLRIMAKSGRTPQEEIRRIQASIENTLRAGFQTFPAPLLAASQPEYWNTITEKADLAVGARISEEFGCFVQITQIMRDKNSLESAVDELVDPVLKQQLTALGGLCGAATARLGDIIASTNFDLEHEEVVKAQENVRQLLEMLEKKIQTATNKQFHSVIDLTTPENNERMRLALADFAKGMRPSISAAANSSS